MTNDTLKDIDKRLKTMASALVRMNERLEGAEAALKDVLLAGGNAETLAQMKAQYLEGQAQAESEAADVTVNGHSGETGSDQ